MVFSHHMSARNWTRLFSTCAISPAPFSYVKVSILPAGMYMHCRCYLIPVELSQSPWKKRSYKISFGCWKIKARFWVKETNVLQGLCYLSISSTWIFILLSKYYRFWIHYGIIDVEVTNYSYLHSIWLDWVYTKNNDLPRKLKEKLENGTISGSILFKGGEGVKGSCFILFSK